MIENNNVQGDNTNKRVFNTKTIIILAIIVIFALSIPIAMFVKNEKSKSFEIKMMANMYAMLEVTNNYISGNIDELEFSRQEGNLMDELDKLKPPKSEVLENSIFTYKTSCAYVVLTVLTTYRDGGNPVLEMTDSVNLMMDCMDRVKEEISKINVDKRADLNYTKKINKEVDDLLEKIKN